MLGQDAAGPQLELYRNDPSKQLVQSSGPLASQDLQELSQAKRIFIVNIFVREKW